MAAVRSGIDEPATAAARRTGCRPRDRRGGALGFVGRADSRAGPRLDEARSRRREHPPHARAGRAEQPVAPVELGHVSHGSFGRPRLPVVRRSSRPKEGAPAACSRGERGAEVVRSGRSLRTGRLRPPIRARGGSARRRTRRAPRARRPRRASTRRATQPRGFRREEIRRRASDGFSRTRRPSSSSSAYATGDVATVHPGRSATTSAPTARPIAAAELRVHGTMVPRGRAAGRMMVGPEGFEPP